MMKLNTCSACKSLFSVQADLNHWWKWLNMHPGCELLSSTWADWNYWWKWLNSHSACEFKLLSSVLADEHCWQKWLKKFQSVSSSPACSENHWQEWLNTCPVCELHSSAFEPLQVALTKMNNDLLRMWFNFLHNSHLLIDCALGPSFGGLSRCLFWSQRFQP